MHSQHNCPLWRSLYMHSRRNRSPHCTCNMLTRYMITPTTWPWPQQRLQPHWACAQSDQILCWGQATKCHKPRSGPKMSGLIWIWVQTNCNSYQQMTLGDKRAQCAWFFSFINNNIIEPRHEISNNVVCATSKGSDQPARSLIRTSAVAWISYVYWATDRTSFGFFKLNRRLHRLVWVYSWQNAALLEITCCGSYLSIGNN